MGIVRSCLHMLLWSAVWLSLPALAAEDTAGSKDHPLLSRYPDSYIAEYEQNYNVAHPMSSNANASKRNANAAEKRKRLRRARRWAMHHHGLLMRCGRAKRAKCHGIERSRARVPSALHPGALSKGFVVGTPQRCVRLMTR